MQTPKHRILVVDDEEGIRFTVGSLLRKEGFEVDEAAGHNDAISCFFTAKYDLAFVDIMLAGDNGIDLLRDIKAVSPATQVVMITGNPNVESAIGAVRQGAFDYISKPIRYETLLMITRHALDVKRTKDQLERSRANMDAIFRTVSDSIVMIDSKGCLVQFNSMAEKVCGYSDDLIGDDTADISLGCGGVCRAELVKTLSSHSRSEIRRMECCTPGGARRMVCFTANPVIEADGAVSGAVAVIRDETHLVELEGALHKRGQFQGLVGASAPMQQVYSFIDALSHVSSTVLIGGESGTGKELVAAALHYNGARAAEPFVKVNCSALSEHLLESELFGHVRGAFTGAIADKIGRFQKAHNGTLFLDEIGDISPAIQMRLLRFLQESEFERVGDANPIKVDVRIIAATNKNLEIMAKQGLFREDLYYRLNVVPVKMPALRNRLDDLKMLIAHFIAKFNKKLGRDIRDVSDDVLRVMNNHAWPGNVRELEHAIEHASILCQSDIISVRDLPQSLMDSVVGSPPSTLVDVVPPKSLQKKLTVQEALQMCGDNKTRAAHLLGVNRATVYRHLEKNLTE